ncbi:unnamed protein product [Effrenium voratum]|uniref:Uncharacterized protein n=1 Tax=Effrenium voratum TaxID=2562239 RepID=A0AA36NDV1_9DINO|nr:unnamed protein product [Effrenium voratum]CAJ1413346.1 unnamed protein product [Effrenium voratum]
MAPKKSGKAKAKPKAENENKEIQWLESTLEKLALQQQKGPEWLKEPHEWHKEQLEELRSRLEGGLKSPSELREGLDFYLSQFEDGQAVGEDEFYIDKELYAELLAPVVEEKLAPYLRRPATEEEQATVAKLKTWSEVTPHGITKVQKVMQANADCAEVQEAGITRLGGLLAEAKAGGTAVPSAAAGLAPGAMCPVVLEGMDRFPRDPGVQRAACSVLRGIVVTDGGCTVVADAGAVQRVVAAMKAHLADVDVCKFGAAMLYAMVQKTGASSPERLTMQATKAYQTLAEVLLYHPTDRALDRAVRVTMPELKT